MLDRFRCPANIQPIDQDLSKPRYYSVDVIFSLCIYQQVSAYKMRIYFLDEFAPMIILN